MQLRAERAEVDTPTGPMTMSVYVPAAGRPVPGVVLYSEIYQETGPVARLAAVLAGHGYVVAVPEIYHEYLAPGTALAYDDAGTAKGNELKYTKPLATFDADARAALDHLAHRPDCNGHVGAAGICIGGHLAYRAALQPDCRAAACFYATDLHSASLGAGRSDDSLARAADIRGELLMVWGRQDPHIPDEGRTLIHRRLSEAGVLFTWHEFNAEHAFLRDEGRRHDPALARIAVGLALDLFHRQLGG